MMHSRFTSQEAQQSSRDACRDSLLSNLKVCHFVKQAIMNVDIQECTTKVESLARLVHQSNQQFSIGLGVAQNGNLSRYISR